MFELWVNFLILRFTFVYLCVYVSVLHVCCNPQRPEESLIPWRWNHRQLWVTRCKWWELNLGLQEEKQALLLSDQYLQPISFILLIYFFRISYVYIICFFLKSIPHTFSFSSSRLLLFLLNSMFYLATC